MTTNNFKPILFSTEMVQAILAGRKTQTRRVVKPQPSYLPYTDSKEGHDKTLKNYINEGLKNGAIKAKYQPGDILWVRETTKVGAWNDEDHKIAFDYAASPELKKTPWVEYQDIDRFEEVHLKTIEALDKKGIEPVIDEENERFNYHWEAGQSPLDWKPSIHMPKEAARIFLKVTNVRAERLQDITEEDAVTEGIEPVFDFENERILGYRNYAFPSGTDAKSSFETLWNSINAKKHPWEYNPWVWVYEFGRIEKPENFLS